MHYTPLKVMLVRDHEDELTAFYRHFKRELDWTYGIVGVITIILFYVYRLDIYRGVLAAISSASGVVTYIGQIL